MSLVRSSWYVRCRRSLCEWCLYDAGSIVSFLIVFMHNELSVSILRWPSIFSLLSARVMAASSALLIACFLFVIWCLCVWHSVFVDWSPRLQVSCWLWLVSRLCRRSLWGSIFYCGAWCIVSLLFGVFVLEWVCLCRTCCCLCWLRLMWWCQLVFSPLCGYMLGWVPCSLRCGCYVVWVGLVLWSLLRCICSDCIFMGWVPDIVCVCGSVIFLILYLVCMLRVRYGVCF